MTVRGIAPDQLTALLDVLAEMGADIDLEENAVTVIVASRLSAASITTQPYPGFPTDLQPQMAALFCTARGESRIRENIWHHRFRYIDELVKMGACANVSDNVAGVIGTPLHGATLTIPDLRAGAALLLAALSAEGESQLHGAHLIERGYEGYIEKLRRIGADVRLAEKKNCKIEQ